MKKSKLKTDDSLFDDYQLYGIVSKLNLYQICWRLNQHFQTYFERIEGAVLPYSQELVPQSIFRFSPNERESYFLIENKTKLGAFSNELKIFDYFIIHRSQRPNMLIEDIKTFLLNQPEIQLIKELDIQTIKERELFLFDEDV